MKKRSYFLHRISHHAEVAYPLLDNGLLSIGFADQSERGFIDKCYKNWTEFDKYFNDINWKPKGRYGLWRFISDMKTGDYVIVPNFWGTFSIYEVQDDKPLITTDIDLNNIRAWDKSSVFIGDKDYLYLDNKNTSLIDLGFFRRVAPIIKNASRADFADSALTSRMKVRQTNLEISDLEESIIKAINSFETNKPINLHGIMLDNFSKQTLNIIKKELNPDKLEKLIAWYFKRVGANSVSIPAKNDRDKEGDADVIASFDPINTTIYVQAKFHENETSSWAVDQITQYKKYMESSNDDYSSLGWVISTADKFNEDSVNMAKANGIRLINGEDFCTMLLEAGIMNLNDAF